MVSKDTLRRFVGDLVYSSPNFTYTVLHTSSIATILISKFTDVTDFTDDDNIDDGRIVVVNIFVICLYCCSRSRQNQQVAATFRTRAQSVIYIGDDHR